MKKGILHASGILFLLIAAIAAVTLSGNVASAGGRGPGAVYVMTNQVANSVAVFERAPDGTLTTDGVFLTGGSGNPVPQGGDPPTDPLASQGSLVLSDDKRFLFAVNAGSNEISVLSVGHDGLTLVNKVDSGGIRPISLTVNEDVLYVLNEGGTPNIAGFTISDEGELSPLPGSSRPLSGGVGADPAQVGFGPDGELLVVTEKATNIINTYPVGSDGVAGAPISNASSGLTPFGFEFDNRGNLIVSEAFGGMANQSAASSYVASAGGLLGVVSSSVPNFQTASCWVVIPNKGQYVYISNTASGTVTSYRLRSSGTMALRELAAGNTGPMSGPIDMAVSNGGRFLYVLGGGSLMVHAFRVEPDGTLTSLGSAGGLPAGVQGIAAR